MKSNTRYSTKVRQKRSRAIRDLVVISIIGLIVFVLAWVFGAFEKVGQWYLLHEDVEVYEFIIVFAVLALALGVFSLRRLSELRHEVKHRKGAEEALRESEARLRTVVDNIDEVVYVVANGSDPAAGTVQFVSGQVKGILGYRPDEFLQDPGLWLRIAHPDDVPVIVEASHKVLATGKAGSREYRLRHKETAEYRWMEDRVVPQLDDDGNVVGVRGVARDVTERKRAEQALRESEEKYRDLVENINEVIYALDASGLVTYVSPAVERIGGYSSSELIGRSFAEFIHADDLAPLIESFQRTVAGNLEPSEYRVLTKSGEIHWVRSSSRPVYDGDRIVGLRAVLMDITDRKRAEDALRGSEARNRALLDAIPDLMCRVSKDGIFVDFKAARDFDPRVTPSQMLGRNVAEVLPPEAARLVMHHVERARREGEIQVFEYQHVLNGGPRDFEARIVVSGEDEVLAIVRDITERKKAEETIRHLAYHDALTGLPNRALFKDRLTVALAQGRRSRQMLAVMYLDLDRFKVVNDTVGHAEGDQLLRCVGERLAGLVREGDTVARVGGDEFTVLLPAIARAEDAVQIADRILESLRGPQMQAGHEFHVTTSIGITVYPNDGKDAETLLRNADTAMYRAKEQGRNNYQLYAPSMNVKILQRLALENSLRRALERQEFVVHYQPKAAMNTGQIVGVEALVRWQHPERGLVLPGEFIPLAEETGLIVPLGEWVLRTACAQAKAWLEAGLPPLRMSVNLSARQFLQPDLVQVVDSALQESGLSPELLEMEITESAAMYGADFSIGVLNVLKEMGVRISIDDFGAGYSSLSYLKSFPIHTIKIDQSFVRDLTTDPNDAAIAAAIVAMAHSLNLNVVAEGVETEEQLAFLRERQCDEFQGFLLARPMPAQALEKMLTRGRRARPRSGAQARS